MITVALLCAVSWDYRTLFYDIGLTVSPPDSSLCGDVSLVVSSAPSDTLPFHLTSNYSIDSLLYNGASAGFVRNSDTVFVLVAAPTDPCTLRVFYHGKTGDRGLHFRDSTFFTFGQFYDSKAWIPCNDTPCAKAPARLRVTVPPGCFVASNGVLDSVRNSTFFWTESHPVAPYLLVVAGGPYVQLDTSWSGIPIHYYVFAGDTAKARASFAHVPDMLGSYSGNFGLYPFTDEKLAFVETEDPIGMETQTCIMVGSHTITGDLGMEFVFAHELAHQWWGDALTPRSWGEIWLNEGFAAWSDFTYTENAYGADSALSRWLWARGLYFSEDSIRQYPLRNPTYFTGATVYYKGAWVVRMLRWVMGDSLFFEGLRFYHGMYADSIVDTDDFESAMEYVAGTCFIWFFSEWCEDVSYPVVEYNWSQVADTVYLTFHQAQVHGPCFTMPVEILMVAGPDSTRDTVWMDSPCDTFALCPGFAVGELVMDPEYRVLMLAERVSSTPETSRGPAGIRLATVGRTLWVENSTPGPVELRAYDVSGRLALCREVPRGQSEIRLPGTGIYRVIWRGGSRSVVITR